jgi:predicted DCC family thiol-disulfide oxidoreductase YuxK
MSAAGKISPVVIVYDAECDFCRSQMDRVRRWDRGGRCEYVAAQDPDLLDRFPQLRGTELADGLRVILPDGGVRCGADAVHAIAQRLPAVRWLSPVYRLPGVGPLSRRAYAWIAANRHALGGRCDNGACNA